MKYLALFLLVSVAPVASSESVPWLLSADDWARPRDGRTVATMPPLPELVSKWSAAEDRRLIIRYPGGEDGLLWAHELRSWLVALGVPMASQELVAGSHQADRIELELTR